MYKSIIMLGILTVATTQAQTQQRDPYRKSRELRSLETYQLKVRIINHGVKRARQWVQQQLRAAEIIYAQCGLNFKLETAGRLELPPGQYQDQLISFQDSQMYFSSGAERLFELARAGKRDDVVDVHVVDHLNSGIRSSGTIVNQSLKLGQAFNPILVNWIFHGSTPQLAGQHVFLAADTVRMATNSFIRIGPNKGYSRNLSLLAHELGHLVLEGQHPEGGNYHDHWCDGVPAYCDFDNLMSAGGNPDKIWRDAQTGRITGYDALPALDQRQCDLLISHPLVKKVSSP
jgi:hypothetical protein